MSKPYTEENLDYLRSVAKGKTVEEITALFNQHFNQNRTKRAIRSVLSRYGIKTGMQGYATRFKKGHKSWNKGKKQTDYLTAEQIDRIKETQFKRGENPAVYKPIGTVRFTSEGWSETKVEEPDVWVKTHRYVWEEAYGEIPYRHVILFKDGNRQNCNLDNLFMVDQAALTTVAKRKALTDYDELNELIYKVTELEVKANVKSRDL